MSSRKARPGPRNRRAGALRSAPLAREATNGRPDAPSGAPAPSLLARADECLGCAKSAGARMMALVRPPVIPDAPTGAIRNPETFACMSGFRVRHCAAPRNDIISSPATGCAPAVRRHRRNRRGGAGIMENPKSAAAPTALSARLAGENFFQHVVLYEHLHPLRRFGREFAPLLHGVQVVERDTLFAQRLPQ